MKAAIALSLLGCVFGFSGKAFAGDAWGPCTPADGTTYHYNVDVDVGIPDAAKNVAGTVLPDVLNWSNGQNVSLICECPDSYKNEKDTLVQGVSMLPPSGRSVDSMKYYTLTEETGGCDENSHQYQCVWICSFQKPAGAANNRMQQSHYYALYGRRRSTFLCYY